MKGVCSGCGNDTFIQNKKYNLCGDCVYKKNHGGKSRQEVYSERNKLKGGSDNPSMIKVLKNIKVKKPLSPLLLGDGFRVIHQDEESLKNEQQQNEAERLEKEGLGLSEGIGVTWVGGDPKTGQLGKLVSVDLISSKKKKQKPIKQISPKQAEINRLYKLACIDMDHVTEPVCTGCLKYQGGDIKLSHSHIISREDCKRIGRPELIYDRDNLTYHCLDFGENVGCHRKHENPAQRKTLADYEKNMQYIKSISEELYQKYN